ncbi:hypothetical protein M422DRAFT_243977 [Sphaerobolus stellatus SS14]|nr:hypothetical protein M422DRAFT_243977 [Sphaerobolus stellatus SS14]
MTEQVALAKLCQHIEITGIRLNFRDLKPSETLQVIVKRPDTEERLKPKTSTKSQTVYLWSFKAPILLFAKDELHITPKISRTVSLLRHRDTLSTVVFKCEDLLEREGVQEIMGNFKGTLTVEKQPGKLSLDSLAHFEASFKAEDMAKSISQLRALFDFIGDKSEILDSFIAFTKATAQIHPIAQAAALLITLPYTLLKNAREYHDSLKAFEKQMRKIFPVLENINVLVKEQLLCSRLTDIVKIIIQAVQFIGHSCKNGNIVINPASQSKLNDFQTQFIAAKDALFKALEIQSASDIQELLTSDSLRALRPPNYREYPLPPACMEGTRQALLTSVSDWLKSTDEPNILYILGSPGSGKSALASSIIQRLLPGRSVHFFFKRNQAYFQDPTIVWRTLAYDLAQLNPHVAKYLHTYLRNHPNYLKNSVFVEHIDTLIINALKAIPKTEQLKAPVIVIDALDECPDVGDNTRNQFIGSLLRWKALLGNFKIIVTGRSERDILSKMETNSKLLVIRSGLQVDHASTKDIKIFLTNSFRDMEFTSGIAVSDQDTEAFGNYAAGLFIWAKTAVTYISRDPGYRLEELRETIKNRVPLDDPRNSMDNLYGQILFSIFKDLNSKEIIAYQIVLGTLLAYKTPLCLKDLKDLLSLTKEIPYIGMVDNAIHDFYCLLEDPGMGKPLQFNHKSFYDFFEGGPERPLKAIQNFQSDHHTPYALCKIDMNEESIRICLTTLKIMNSRLCFNISQITSSYLFNDDIVKFNTKDTQLPEALTYSCQYWAAHLADINLGAALNKDLCQEAKKFFEERFLYWLEVMSLKRSIGNVLASLLSASITFKGMEEFILETISEDASQFVTHFYDAISTSIPHIYLSALAFSPPSSEVAKNYYHKFSIPRVLQGRLKEWSQIKQIIRGHGSVHSVAFSPDGQYIVSGSSDKTIQIWDSSTGKLVGEPLRGHSDSVTCVAYSPDGESIVSGSYDKTIRIWNVTRQSGDILMEHHSGILSLTYSPDGKYIASGGYDFTIHIWDTSTGQEVGDYQEEHDGEICSVAYSPDGKCIVSGSADNTIRMWNISTGQPVGNSWERHVDWVRSVAYSPDGKYIVSGSNDRKIYIWDSNTGQLVGRPLTGHTGSVSSVAYSHNGKYIASGSDDKTVRIWNVSTGQSMGEPLKGHDRWVNFVAYSPNMQYIASGSSDQTIHIWNVPTGEQAGESFRRYDAPFTLVIYSPDGKNLVSSSNDHIIQIWDANTGLQVGNPLEGHDDDITSLAYSPNGKCIVSGSIDKTIRIWDASTGQPIGEALKRNDAKITWVAYSPDGKYIASSYMDNTIHIWDTSTRQLVGNPLIGHEDYIVSFIYSPDGKYIASGSHDRTIRIWDVSSRQSVGEPLKGHNDYIMSIAYSPSGKYIFSGSADKTIRIWDVKTGQLVGEPLIGHKNNVNSVACSPDGKYIVSGSADYTVRIWDTNTEQLIGEPLIGHEGFVNSVQYSPDGKYIVSASVDHTIRIWDAFSEQSMSNTLEAVALSPTLSPSQTIQPTPLASNTIISSLPKDYKSTYSFFTAASGESCFPPNCFIKKYVVKQHEQWHLQWLLRSSENGSTTPRPLLWRPPVNRASHIYWPQTSLIIAKQPPTLIDFSEAYFGEQWTKIYRGND